VVKSAADRTNAEYLRLVLRVTPKGGRDAIEGWQRDVNGKPVLNVRIAAAPEDGKANAALLALLAQHFNVSKNAVTILRGTGARIKHVHVRGDPAKLSAHLAQIGGGG
jgi:uncharacterized protein